MTHEIKPPTAAKMAVRTALILFLFVVIFTGLLSGAYLWTLPTIEAAAAEEKMKLINEVLPKSSYDNDLLRDTLKLDPTPALGQDGASTAYLARKGGQPNALVLEAIAPDGYAGKIRLLIALDTEGALLGVRVTQHKETPGLGDKIELAKSKWIRDFEGKSLESPPAEKWAVKKDGGVFDQFAGATITPRAVVKAVKEGMKFYVAHRDEILEGK